MTSGWVDSIRISSTARYTANFSAPTAKASFDGSTMLLLNFDNNFDQFTTATTSDGPAYLFLRRIVGGYGQVADLQFRDLSLIGTGPYAIYMVNSRFENVTTTTYWRGIQLLNNDYLNRLTSVTINWSAPGSVGSTTPGTGTFTTLKCQSFAGMRCADAYPGADWGAKVSAAIADLPAGGGIVDARALTGSQTLSSDLVIANKSITILAGQTTLAMGSNRIMVQPGANQFAFTGYGAGWGPDQSFTAGGTTLQYTGNGSAFKVGASTSPTNFIRLEDFQVDASGGGSAARAMEIDNTIGATLSNVKLLVSTATGTIQEALRLDGTGGMNAYIVLNNLYLGGGHNTLHLTGASGQGNSAFQIIGGTARTNNTTDGTGVLLEYASNVDFLGFDVESALVGYSFGSGAMQNILT